MGLSVCCFFLPEGYLQLKHAELRDIISILYLGIFPAAIAYTGWAFAIKHLRFSSVITIVYIQPLIVIIMQWVVFKQAPLLLAIFGGVISTLGALFVSKVNR